MLTLRLNKLPIAGFQMNQAYYGIINKELLMNNDQLETLQNSIRTTRWLIECEQKKFVASGEWDNLRRLVKLKRQLQDDLFYIEANRRKRNETK
jgi:hypothetical protein